MDALRYLEAEHAEVDSLMTQLEKLQTQAAGSGTAHLEERATLFNQILRDLSRHAAVEETHLYPLARKHVDDDAVDKALTHHQEAKNELHAVDGVSPDAADFDEHVRALIAGVREHVAFEEGELFPRLRAALDDEKLRDLGEKLQKAEQKAPTHPHPKAPNRPPANRLLGPATGLIDRVRDHLVGRR